MFFILAYIWAYILTNILQLDVAPSFSCLGTSKYDPIQRRYARNCIGEVIRLVRPTDKRYFKMHMPFFFASSLFILKKFIAPEVVFWNWLFKIRPKGSCIIFTGGGLSVFLDMSCNLFFLVVVFGFLYFLILFVPFPVALGYIGNFCNYTFSWSFDQLKYKNDWLILFMGCDILPVNAC